MSNQDKLIEIQKLMHEKQNRFVYYISGLCVASIGFSVNQTVNDKLNCSHILLGIALVCWFASIFCSFQFIQIKLQVLFENARILNIIELTKPEEKDKAIDKGNAHLAEYTDKQSNRTHNNFMQIQYWFYAGMVLFIAWRIVEMTKN